MKTILAVLFVLTSAAMAPVTAQVEHAPTVAQCQADQKLWLSQSEMKEGLDAFRSDTQ
jgi:hypothetical protein